MVSNVGQNRSKREAKQMQAEHTLRALQDQIRCLTDLPIQTLEDAKAAAAKGKDFVTQLNNLKKALIELQQQDTVPHRLHKQGDLAAAKREQEQVQQFCEERKREINALIQQYKSWDKQVKDARKELGGGGRSVISDDAKNATVLMKSVSKSGFSVTSLDSEESSSEKLVGRSNSSKLVDDDGSLRMVLVKDENKEVVKMVDEERLGDKNGGFSEGSCVVEEIDEQLSGRSSLLDLREIEEDQRLALEDDREKRLITRGHSSSNRFKDLIDMRSDEDFASSAILLADESRDLVHFGEQDGNVMRLERTNGAFESCVTEECVEFPSQQKMAESFGSNNHEHGEDESDEDCETVLEASNMSRNSGIQIPIRPNDHEQGEDENNEDCGTVLDASNMRRNSGIQIPIRPPNRVSKGKDKVGDAHKGSKESTFENKSSTLECITESMNPNDKKVIQSDDDGVSSNMAEPAVGSPKDNLKEAHLIPGQRSLDIESKLKKWRYEVHFDNDESPLPVWSFSDFAKSAEEEIESLKECWKLRQENMKVPVKIQCLEDLARSFLDKQSQHKFRSFHAQTMPKFENKIEELTALDAAEENIMEVAAGVKPLDAMNEIDMMEDLLSHNKMLENSLNSTFKRETMEPEGNELIELEKEIEKAPTFKKFTDVHLLEEEGEDVKPTLKTIITPQYHATFDEKVHNGREKLEWNLETKDQILRMNLVQSQKLAHQTFMKEPTDENPFVKDEAETVTQFPEQRIELSDTEGIEEAMKRSTKPLIKNCRGLKFNIQNSTNCFFPEPALAAPAPASAPGIHISEQSPRFRALEKRVSKVEEKQLKAEREFVKKTVEKLVQSEIKKLDKAQRKEKKQSFWTLVLSTMAILVAGLAYVIYKVEKSPPPT